MKTIVIYRKQSTVAPVRRAAADVKTDRESIAARTRVKREAVLDHFAPSGRQTSPFHKQNPIPAAIIDNPPARIRDHADDGWIVPEDCLGRAPKRGERDYESTAQSVLLWIKQNVCEMGWADASEVSVVVEER